MRSFTEMHMFRFRWFVLAAACVACGESADPTPAPDLTETLRAYLVGDFDSSTQASRDPEYFDIQLATCDVSAPELGDVVVYVEQAVASTPDEPYRQRLYVLSSEPGSTEASTEVYALTDEAAAIGLCGRSQRPSFAMADVTLRTGCGVALVWDAEASTFTGGTQGQRCESSLSGASYATSEVTIREARVDSWDRGYDTSGAQVWGAVSGPYRFRRR